MMLAQTFDPGKHNPAGHFMSEKLDGMRAFWDGGISKGKDARTVGYMKESKDCIATGLWSRLGNVIHAPSWWTAHLPDYPLDGELYLLDGDFQDIVSICRSHSGDWRDVKYFIFDMPPFDALHVKRDMPPFRVFENVYNHLKTLGNKVVIPHRQILLPLNTATAKVQMYQFLDTCVEGLMLRKQHSIWTPKRCSDLLKLKKIQDAEGVVVGWKPGKGKFEGMMGSLELSVAGDLKAEISGFTDDERLLLNGWPIRFPAGTVVAFTFREMTKGGKDFKEARFDRERTSVQ